MKLFAAFAITATLGVCKESTGPRSAAQSIARVGAVVVTATVQVLRDEPPGVLNEVLMLNASSEPTELFIAGGCPMHVRIFEMATLSGRPKWSSYPPPEGQACIANLIRVEIPANGRHVIRMRIPVKDILGDSLPSGVYYFSSVVDLSVGQVEIHAGQAKLIR